MGADKSSKRETTIGAPVRMEVSLKFNIFKNQEICIAYLGYYFRVTMSRMNATKGIKMVKKSSFLEN